MPQSQEAVMGVISGIGSAARHAGLAVAQAAVISAIIVVAAFTTAALTGVEPELATRAEAAPKVKATMVASPTTVSVDERLSLTGVGLDPDKQAWVRTETSSAVGWRSLGVDADGRYSIDLAFPTTGTVKIAVFQVVRSRNVLMSSCYVHVQ